MKKTYNKPTLKVVNIQPTQFIATSGQLDPTQEITSSSEIGARRSRFSSWEDEE